jgi:hypothetical protein
MIVITKKMLMMMTAFVTLMAAFVTVKMLMMATNVVNLTMPAFVTMKMLMMATNVVNLAMPTFVNDGCNPMLMMAVIIAKMFFQMVSICRLTVGR